MVGPALSLAHVPLGEVLPDDYAGAEGELRRLADALESHPAAAGRSAWHWFPEHRQAPHPSDRRLYLLLVDITITLYDDARSDWLELNLDIAWQPSASLTVNAAVNVACWCPRDHAGHLVRTAQWHPVDSRELVEAVAAGTAMLTDVLTTGPFHPRPWRAQAGLPDAPETSR